MAAPMFPKHHLGTGRAFKGTQSGSKRRDLGRISPQASPFNHQRLALTDLRQLPLGKLRQVEGRAAAHRRQAARRRRRDWSLSALIRFLFSHGGH